MGGNASGDSDYWLDLRDYCHRKLDPNEQASAVEVLLPPLAIAAVMGIGKSPGPFAYNYINPIMQHLSKKLIISFIRIPYKKLSLVIFTTVHFLTWKQESPMLCQLLNPFYKEKYTVHWTFLLKI